MAEYLFQRSKINPVLEDVVIETALSIEQLKRVEEIRELMETKEFIKGWTA